jgi:hypothetical protein
LHAALLRNRCILGRFTYSALALNRCIAGGRIARLAEGKKHLDRATAMASLAANETVLFEFLEASLDGTF